METASARLPTCCCLTRSSPHSGRDGGWATPGANLSIKAWGVDPAVQLIANGAGGGRGQTSGNGGNGAATASKGKWVAGEAAIIVLQICKECAVEKYSRAQRPPQLTVHAVNRWSRTKRTQEIGERTLAGGVILIT